MRFASRHVLLGLLVVSLLSAASAQETKIPSAEEAKAWQEKFRDERDKLVKTGWAKRFLPVLLDKAEGMGKRADEALSQNRLLQASELYRQARWQLPYQSPNVPEKHVARVLGNLRLRHSQEINDVAFSPDGKLLATASRDRTVKVWNLENGHELVTYLGHGDAVRHVAFSPDGKTVASAGAERDIRLWNPADGKDVRVIKGQGAYVTSMALSRDGKTLVVANDDRAVRLYDVASGDLKRELGKDRFNQRVESVAFNQDGSLLAIGVADGFIKLWQYPNVIANQNQPEYWAQQDPEGSASSIVAFSPDNRTLARVGPQDIKLYNTPLPGGPFQPAAPRKTILTRDTLPKSVLLKSLLFGKDNKTIFVGASDGLIYLFDAETGQSAGTFKGHNGEVRALAFNSAGSQLASASADYTVRLWTFDVVLQSRDIAVHTDSVWSAAFSPDGQRFASASADKTVKVVEVGSGKVVHSLPHQAGVTVVLYSPDGKIIASGGGDKVIKLWDADSGKPLQSLEGHQATVTSLDFTGDSKKLVSADVDKRIKVWDLGKGKEAFDIGGHPSVATAVALSPDGKWLATGNVDQSIRLYHADSGKPGPTWSAHGVAVTGLAFSPNGQRLASCGADFLVRVWPFVAAKGGDPDPAGKAITLAGHGGPLSAVAFRKDNQHLVSCGSDMTVKLWKLEGDTGKEAQTFRGHKDWVTSVAFSRDGHYILSTSVDKGTRIWEITSREIPLQSEHTGAVHAVAVSQDGKLIASGATDRSIKIWDREKGVEVMTLHGHAGGIHCLAFADDKTLVSSGEDKTMRRWDVTAGKELAKHDKFNFPVEVPYIVVPRNGKKVLTWEPLSERGSDLTAFDLASGEDLIRVQDHGKRHVVAASFSADGKRAATAGKDGNVRLFDLEKKKGEERIGGDWLVFDKGIGLGDLALTPDGSILVATSDKGDVKILDVAKRETLHTIAKAHGRNITACIVSPDGKRFATVGQDNIIKLFDLAKGTELRQWETRMPAQDRGAFVATVAFTPEGRYLVTANANTSLFLLELPE